jgi:hypothetical protein
MAFVSWRQRMSGFSFATTSRKPFFRAARKPLIFQDKSFVCFVDIIQELNFVFYLPLAVLWKDLESSSG